MRDEGVAYYELFVTIILCDQLLYFMMTKRCYVCKFARKKGCNKKREEKNGLELDVTAITIKELSDKKHVRLIVDKMTELHGRRTDTVILRSLEVRITNTSKEMDDTTTA